MKTKLDLSDDDEENGDTTTEVSRLPSTPAVDKSQQQYQLVQSFGSEKQKRFLANARRSIVDSKDLDTSMTTSLETFDYHSMFAFLLILAVLVRCLQFGCFCLV